MTEDKKYLSLDGLTKLVSNIASRFSAKDHVHTMSQITDASTVIDNKVSTHNVETNAHNDMRLLINDIDNRLNALADSDDTTLDQLSEITAYIKANRELVEQVTTVKVNVDDIVDNLTTNVSDKPLSAAQGVALKQFIPTNVSQLNNDSCYLTSSNIPIMLGVEEWRFELDDGSTITKSVATSTSISQEEFIFELEDGSTISKMVVIE